MSFYQRGQCEDLGVSASAVTLRSDFQGTIER